MTLYANLDVYFFNTPIANDEVKRLLLSSQPNDFFWGTEHRPPYLFDYRADGNKGTWSISGGFDWYTPPARRKRSIASSGVRVLLKNTDEPIAEPITVEHLRQALFVMPQGTIFKRDEQFFRILKRTITLNNADSAELEVTVENT